MRLHARICVDAISLCRLDKVQKRASNVLKLAQENEKLKEELRAMNERIEAAERRQKELRQQRGSDATKAAS